MNKTSKVGMVLTIVVAVLVIGLIWFVVAGSRDTTSNSLSVSTPYGDTSDRIIQSDFNKMDSQFGSMDSEARDMDSYNL